MYYCYFETPIGELLLARRSRRADNDRFPERVHAPRSGTGLDI